MPFHSIRHTPFSFLDSGLCADIISLCLQLTEGGCWNPRHDQLRITRSHRQEVAVAMTVPSYCKCASQSVLKRQVFVGSSSSSTSGSEERWQGATTLFSGEVGHRRVALGLAHRVPARSMFQRVDVTVLPLRDIVVVVCSSVGFVDVISSVRVNRGYSLSR